jgi:hypothetical protein
MIIEEGVAYAARSTGVETHSNHSHRFEHFITVLKAINFLKKSTKSCEEAIWPN